MDLTLMKHLSPEELVPVLEKAVNYGGKVTQSGPAGKIVSSINHIEITHDKKIAFSISDFTDLESERPLLINLAYRNLSFRIKSSSYSVSGNKIVSELPSQARALQIRDGDRYLLSCHSKVKSSIRRSEIRDGYNEMELQIADVSPRGIGAYLHHATESSLCQHDHVWVKTINCVMLEQPIFGKVVYVSGKNELDPVRVGIALSSPLPEELLEEFKQMSHLILAA